jgi:hypothetical protein
MTRSKQTSQDKSTAENAGRLLFHFKALRPFSANLGAVSGCRRQYCSIEQRTRRNFSAAIMVLFQGFKSVVRISVCCRP